MRWAQAATLVAIAGILGYQLLIPPVIGLADQGDYARLLGAFHLGPTAQTGEERYYRYFNRTYQPDPNFRLPGWEIYSTQDILVGSAVLLNKWISKDGLLDIRVLSFLEILVFLAICYFLLRAARKLLSGRLQFLISSALILVFCDIGYVCYFNSFYSEPATYLSLMALLAVWLDFIASKPSESKSSTKHIALFCLFALLFVAAKPQNVAAGIILGFYSFRFRRLFRPRWAGPAVAAGILAACVTVYSSVPRLVRLADIYNMIFMQMLPESSNPALALRNLGLDSSYAKFSGSGAFAPTTGFWDPAFQNQLDARVGRFTIVQYYLERPAKLINYVRAVLPRGASLRAEGVGNFEKSAGYPPFARARSFALWSRFRERYVSRWSSGVLIGLMLSVFATGWMAAHARRIEVRLVAECYAVLALMDVAAFFTAILGDAHDVVKHLHLYNLLTDVCLVFAITALFRRVSAGSDGDSSPDHRRSAAWSRTESGQYAERSAPPRGRLLRRP